MSIQAGWGPKKALWLIFPGAFLAIAVGVYFSLFRHDALPERLGPLALVKETSGEEARVIVDKLHGKGLAPKETRIGSYASSEGNATLYVSSYEEVRQARKSTDEMASGIQAGNSAFGHALVVDVKGRTMMMCIGLGQVHYFFSNEKNVYWLAADPAPAAAAIEELTKALHDV